MPPRAPTTCPGPSLTGAGGALRIVGAYPPPVPPALPPITDTEAQALLARPPQVTRYERTRHRAARKSPSRAARGGAGTSALLTVAGIAAVVVLPQDTKPPT